MPENTNLQQPHDRVEALKAQLTEMVDSGEIARLTLPQLAMLIAGLSDAQAAEVEALRKQNDDRRMEMALIYDHYLADYHADDLTETFTEWLAHSLYAEKVADWFGKARETAMDEASADYERWQSGTMDDGSAP